MTLEEEIANVEAESDTLRVECRHFITRCKEFKSQMVSLELEWQSVLTELSNLTEQLQTGPPSPDPVEAQTLALYVLSLAAYTPKPKWSF